MNKIFADVTETYERYHSLCRGDVYWRECGSKGCNGACGNQAIPCVINRIFIHLESCMARTSGKKSKPLNNFNTEFIRYDLDEKDKKAFKLWAAKPNQSTDAMISEVLESGNKITYSYNEANKSFICSVTGKKDESLNSEKCFTSHGKDPVTAGMVALFKYFEIWGGELWEGREEPEEDFG